MNVTPICLKRTSVTDRSNVISYYIIQEDGGFSKDYQSVFAPGAAAGCWLISFLTPST